MFRREILLSLRQDFLKEIVRDTELEDMDPTNFQTSTVVHVVTYNISIS